MIYKGMCVGGLADGSERQADKESMYVEARKRLPDGSAVPTGARTNYRFLILLGNEIETIGVWVPEGIEDAGIIVKRLLKFYKPLIGTPLIHEVVH